MDDSNVVKFPYTRSRRAHCKKPRCSKNGTPEQRALKAAASLTTPADVVTISQIRQQAHSQIDRRKLRGSPLREFVSAIAFGATVVGKMHTAGLRGEPLAAVDAETRKEWLETLDRAEGAMIAVAIGFEKATETLKSLKSENSYSPLNLAVPDLGQSVLNLATEESGTTQN